MQPAPKQISFANIHCRRACSGGTSSYTPLKGDIKLRLIFQARAEMNRVFHSLWMCLLLRGQIQPCSCFVLRNSRAKGNSGRSMSIPNSFDTLASGLASICRLLNGVSVTPGIAPSAGYRLLKLYDIENSRSCRSVRETITELDLVVERLIPSAENSRAIVDKNYLYALPSNQEVPCLVIR